MKTSYGKSWEQLSTWGQLYVIGAWFFAVVLVAGVVASLFGLHAYLGMFPLVFLSANVLAEWIFVRREVGDFSLLSPSTRRIVTWPLFACVGATALLALVSLYVAATA